MYGRPCSCLPKYYQTKVPHKGFPALAVAVTTSNTPCTVVVCHQKPADRERNQHSAELYMCQANIISTDFMLRYTHTHVSLASQSTTCITVLLSHHLLVLCNNEFTHVGKGVACCFPAHLETRKRKRSYIVSKVPTFLITPKGSCIAVQGTIIIGFCQHHQIP